jgi:hypothetical protein
MTSLTVMLSTVGVWYFGISTAMFVMAILYLIVIGITSLFSEENVVNNSFVSLLATYIVQYIAVLFMSILFSGSF